jgi:hypothetical protein
MVAGWNNSPSRKFVARSFLVTAFAALLPCAAVAQSTSDHVLREARVPLGTATQPAPKYTYLFSPTARWAGPLRWKYNHANAPQSLAADKAAVIAQLQKSFDKWSSQCGITYVYEGETATPPNNLVNDPTYGPQPDAQSVVGWGTIDPSLGAWTYAWYYVNGGQRVIFDADVTLSTTNIVSLTDLDRLVTHEWGHALGLDHSNTESAIMAGPPSTHYNQLVTPQADDVRGCRCQYGLPSGVSAPYACSIPAKVDFGDTTLGSSSTQTVTFTNSGNAPLSIQTSTIGDPKFKHVTGCTPGTVVTPGATCTMQLQATPAAAGAIASQIALFTNDGYYEIALAANGVAGSSGVVSGPTVDVVEYYNASLDHYFITWIAAEMANLDAGMTPTKWTRTGRTFKAYATAVTSSSQVCRYYIPPAKGSSHFFGRSAAECAASQQAQPDLILEDPNYMHVVLPQAGTCPSSMQPVYRMFNNRPDANHRYTIDRAVRDDMVAKGWVAEGDGPDRVAMCVPAQ